MEALFNRASFLIFKSIRNSSSSGLLVKNQVQFKILTNLPLPAGSGHRSPGFRLLNILLPNHLLWDLLLLQESRLLTPE